MTIQSVPTSSSPNRQRVEYYDLQDRRRIRIRSSQAAANQLLADDGGMKSLEDLQRLPVEPVLKAWLVSEQKRMLQARSIRSTERYLTGQFVPLVGEMSIGAVSVAECKAFRRKLTIDLGLGASTVYGACKALEAFFGYAMRRGFVDSNPAAVANVGLKARKAYKQGRPLGPTNDELNEIRAASDPLELVLIHAVSDVAAMPTELQGLQWGHCNFAARTLRLRGTCTPFDPTGEILSRTELMTPRLAASLIRLQLIRSRGQQFPEPIGASASAKSAADTYVFETGHGGPMRTGEIGKLSLKPQIRSGLLTENAGLAGRGSDEQAQSVRYTCLNLRHALARRLAGTMGLKKLARRLGLEVSTTVQCYGHLYQKQAGLQWTLSNPPLAY